jgi:4,5-DOPA dioxygenase extradiol
MTQHLPPLFVSHGSPMTAIADSPARRFLLEAGRQYEKAYGRPTAILAVSAHWETASPAVSGATRPETIHDFGGFPRALYQLQYPAPGAPDLAARVRALGQAAGIGITIDPGQGLDHGAWVPLLLMWPGHDIPVAQLAIQTHLGPAHQARLGAALAPLADEGVLVMGSGSATHNLRDTFGRMQRGDNARVAWAEEFDTWLDATLAAGDLDALIDYRRRAPHAATAHPQDEHLQPVHTALAAAGPGARGRLLHRSFEAGSLSMSTWVMERAA